MSVGVTTSLTVAGLSAAGNAFLGAVYKAAAEGKPKGVVEALYDEPLTSERAQVLAPLGRALSFVNAADGRFFEGQLQKAAAAPRNAEAVAGNLIGLFDNMPGDRLLEGARILRGASAEPRLQPSFAQFDPSLMAAVLAVLGPEKTLKKEPVLPTREDIVRRAEEFEVAVGHTIILEEILWGVLERGLMERDVEKIKMVVAALLLREVNPSNVAGRLILHRSPLIRRWAAEALIALSENAMAAEVLYKNQKEILLRELHSSDVSPQQQAIFLIAAFADWGVGDARRWLKDLRNAENPVHSETAAFALDEEE